LAQAGCVTLGFGLGVAAGRGAAHDAISAKTRKAPFT
jgi:hypothetical protein